MKFTLATVAILATAVSAQTIASLQAEIPTCAQSCLTTAIAASGCGATDNACQCGSGMAAITKSATPCVITGCSSDDALKTQSVTGQICALVAAGGSSGGSSSAASSATSAAQSATSAASSAASSASSAASSAESASSSATSAAASASESAVSVSSSAAAAASSVASSAASSASKAASSAASAAASKTSSAATTATNAAGKKEVGSIMAGAALLAAIAL